MVILGKESGRAYRRRLGYVVFFTAYPRISYAKMAAYSHRAKYCVLDRIFLFCLPPDARLIR